MANRYWVGGTGTWNTTSTTNWSATSGGAGGASVPTAADSVFFDQAATYTVTMTGALNCLDITVSAGTVTFATGTTPTLSVAGNWSTIAGTVWNSTGTVTFTATTSKTITSGGITIGAPFTFNGSGGTWTLQDNLTLGSTLTTNLAQGTLALGSFTLTTGLFQSNSGSVRNLNFGTGKIVLNSATTSTIWNTYPLSGPLTTSGSLNVECIGGGTGVTKTITTSTPAEGQAINFSLLETTGSVTYTFAGGTGLNPVINNLTVNGANQTITNVTLTLYGNFTYSNTNGNSTFSAGTSTWTFASTSAKTITSNGITLDFPITFNGVGGSWTLQDSMTVGSTRTVTFTNGTLALGSFTFTCGLFSSNNSNTRTINFGTGKFVLNNNATNTIWVTSQTGLTISGTPLVECIGGGAAVTKTINTGSSVTEANAVSFSLLETTGTATYAFTAGNAVKNLITNGVQTLSNIAITIYGTFTHQTTNGTTTFTAGTNSWTFGATSGSYTIGNLAATTYDFPWIFGSATSTATWKINANLVLGATRQLTLTNGTFDFNNKTFSGAGVTILTGTPSIANTGSNSLSLTVPITHTSGSLTLPFNLTTSSASGYTFTAGTLALSTFTLTTPLFSSANSNARTLNFGTGKIVLNGTATATIWNTSTVTNLTVSGTPLVESIGGGTAVTKTISTGTPTEANAISFSLLETTGTVTYSFAAGMGIKNLIINGLQTLSNIAVTIYGAFTHSTGNGTTTFTAGTNAWTFGATSGSYTITNLAATTYDFPWIFGSATSTAIWSLAANLTLGATRQLTLTNGTIDFNNKTLSAAGITILTGTPSISNTTGGNANSFTTTLPITHTSGTLTLTNDLTTSSASGYTLTAGTLALGTSTLTTPVFSSANSNVRTINFGTGKIVLNGSVTATIWNTSTVTNLTISGTSLVESIGGGTAVTKTISTGTPTEANSISFSLLNTTGTVTYSFASGMGIRSLIVNGLQTVNNFALSIYGSFTHQTTNGTTTFQAGTGAWTFAATSGSYTITNIAGFTYDFPWTFGSAASTATWTLAANLTLGATRQLTLTNGTFDFNSKTLSSAGLTILTGNPVIANTGTASLTLSVPITQTSGNLSLPFNLTTTAAAGFVHTAGTLTFNNFTFTTPLVNSGGTSTRAFAFGTGKFVLNGAVTTTIWNSNHTGLTVTGTPLVECIGGGTGVTKTINAGSSTTEANAISFSLLETTGTVTYAWTNSVGAIDNLIVNGSQTVNGAALTIYGTFTHLTTNGTTTFPAGSTWTFAATSGNYTINNIAGFTYDWPWTFGSASASTATWTLANNLTLGATRQLSLANGTFDFNSKTFSGAGVTIVTGTPTIANTGTSSLSLTVPITHTSGSLTLPFNLTTTGNYIFTAGTLNINNFVLTALSFSSSGASNRTLAFGSSGQFAITGNGQTIWDTGTATNFVTTGTVYINSTYTGSTGTRTFTTGFSVTQAAGYSFSTSGTTGIVFSPTATDTIALTGGFDSINLTGFTGTLSNTNRTIYGNLTVPASGGTYTAGTNATNFAATSGTKTITTNGRTLDFPITFNGAGGTFQLIDNLTLGSTRTATLSQGTLDLNNNTLSASIFNSNNSNTRSIGFGSTGKITVVGNSATVVDFTTGTTNFTYTGTPKIYSTYNGATGTRTFNFGGTNASAATSSTTTFNMSIGTSGDGLVITPGTDQLSFIGGFNNFDLTGLTQTIPAVSGDGKVLWGNLTIPATGGTINGGVNGYSMYPGASTTTTITTNGRAIDTPVSFNGPGTCQLVGNTSFLRGMTLSGGTVDLNDFTLSAQTLSSSNSTARALSFGTTGVLSLSGNNLTIVDFATMTNFTYTGTPRIYSTYPGATGTRTFNIGTTAGATATNVFDVSIGTTGTGIVITAGTDILTLSGSYNVFNMFDLSQTLTNTSRSVYGDFTVPGPSSPATINTGANPTTFVTTSTQTITTNARQLNFPVIINNTGTTSLAGALSLGSTIVFTLTGGTFDTNNFTVTALSLSSNNSNVRSLNFGTTGQFTLAGSNATIVDFTTATNFTYTGTPRIYSNYNGSTGTRTFNFGGTAGATSSNVFDVNQGSPATKTGIIIAGGGDIKTLTGGFGAVDLSNLPGSLSNTVRSIYGNFTTTAGITLTAGTNATTFATAGTQNITTNGLTLDFPITINSTGTTVLQDSLTIGSTRTLTLTAGNLDLNNVTCTVGFFATAAGTKSITFDSGTLTITGSGATAFNNAQPTNFTTSAGTGVGTIKMTSATAKTFVGGGSTYACYLDQAGSADLTVTGQNTFESLKSSYASTTGNATIILPTGTTTIQTNTLGGTSNTRYMIVKGTNSRNIPVLKINSSSRQISNYMQSSSIVFTSSNLFTDGSTPWIWYFTNSVNNGDTLGVVFSNDTSPTAPKIYYITQGTSFTIPSDWNSSNNTIHIWGGGGGGGGGRDVNNGAGNIVGGSGGGGGGYTQVLNYSANPNSAVAYTIGAAGTAGAIKGNGGNGGQTSFAGTYTANGGTGGTSTNTSTTAGTGGTGSTYNGGAGGTGTFTTNSTANSGGGGGGGAAGPNGNGGKGGNGLTAQAASTNQPGGGGGGYSGGANGAIGTTTTGGAGGNNFFGSGGATTTGADGTNGGGGAGGIANIGGGIGSIGIDILSSTGGAAGGGGGMVGPGVTATPIYFIGCGGAGGGCDDGGVDFPGSAGGTGGIIITYIPSSTPNNNGFFMLFN